MTHSIDHRGAGGTHVAQRELVPAPGDGNPGYTDPAQQLRDGDVAKLALELPGLPTIEGSLMMPGLPRRPD